MKRTITIVLLLLGALGLGFYAFYALTKIDTPGNVNEQVDIVEESTQPTTPTKPVNNTEPEEREPVQDRVVRGSNVVISERSGKDIEINAEEDLAELPAGTYVRNQFDFADGIVLLETDYILPMYGIYNGNIECVSKLDMDSDVRILIKEVKADTTIQEKRVAYLKDKAFNYYADNAIDTITIDKTVILGKGYENYQSLFEEPINFDPTFHTIYKTQIVCDDTIKTALGNAIYLVIYNSAYGTYDSVTYINYNGRQLEIDISASDEEAIYFYVVELTNNVIHIINKGD